jgi:hypothetical protein
MGLETFAASTLPDPVPHDVLATRSTGSGGKDLGHHHGFCRQQNMDIFYQPPSRGPNRL